MIYLDNAATSGKKPEQVYTAVHDALITASGNPGRSGHQVSINAGNLVQDARLLCSRLFHAESPESIVFCFNGTDALNLAIKGILREGDHVITSSIEHNSVARPLEYLKNKGVQVTKLTASAETGVDPAAVEAALQDNTRMVIINHISNVTGTVNDIEKIGAVCRKNGILFLADAAQSAGARDIDVQKMNIDLLAFPGHKCLLGPQGTGGLYIRPGIDLEPLKQGGTGSRSELLYQPEQMPDKYESGTLNVPGLAGLAAGIDFLLKEGMDAIQEKEKKLTQQLVEGLSTIEGVTLYGPSGINRGPVVSINIEGTEPQDAALLLDQVFGIAVRSGLHCAPDAHRTIGTLEQGGTIRISPGYFNSEADIQQCIEAVEAISKGEV